jgi:uncharacterized protein (TIGR00369 family)
MMDFAVLQQVMNDFIPFNRFCGFRVVSIEPGKARMEVAFRPELIGDPTRHALHGGVISALADTCGGCAVWSSVKDMHSRVSTIDLRIDYLRPGKAETLIAEAVVVRSGNRVGVCDVRLFHESAQADTVATGKGVYNISRPKNNDG